MKILHIIPSLVLGGAERLVLDICINIQKHNGHEVRLLCFRNDNVYGNLSEKIHCDVVPASVTLSVFKQNESSTALLQKYIDDFKPDIIHSHLFEAEIVSRTINYSAAKWFTHCHDNMRQFETFGANTLFNKVRFTEFYERNYLLNRYKANGGNYFIAISKDTENYFKRVLPSALCNVTLLHNGVDIKNFNRPESVAKKRKADLELVTVGGLVENKNHSFLFNVVKRLKRKKYNVHLSVLGDGPCMETLKKKITELGLTQEITLYGTVQNVEEFLWNSDIYVHAALSEAFGLVLVEAMAAGLPVVCLDANGNRDIIQHQKNGFILKRQDVKEFGDKIGLLYHDKFRYEQMKQEGLTTAAKFDIVNYTDKLLALYQKALNGEI